MFSRDIEMNIGLKLVSPFIPFVAEIMNVLVKCFFTRPLVKGASGVRNVSFSANFANVINE